MAPRKSIPPPATRWPEKPRKLVPAPPVSLQPKASPEAQPSRRHPAPPPLHPPRSAPENRQVALPGAPPGKLVQPKTGPLNPTGSRLTAPPPLRWPSGRRAGSGTIQPMNSSQIKEPVNRRDKEYHKERIKSLNDLDKVASFLLASNYSYKKNQSKVSQGLIQMDCVAVVVIKGSYWMASNSQGLDGEDAANLNGALEMIELDYELVVNGTKNKMHAEMQLVQELLAKKIETKGLFMGVSKPCCLDCHKVLSILKINHTAYHNSQVINWEPPNNL
ncbi:MAG TPA: hypothetical protein VMM92_01060 [Thermoanaerobaculia bacterium]|nr:hypothetical protein [Thermoanaerobaculia bacterium]